MRLDLKFVALGRALREMGVELNPSKYGSPSFISPELKDRLENEGDDFENIDEIQVRGGVLTFAGQQIVVYIRSSNTSQFTLRTAPVEGPKYHITWCSILQQMKDSGRYHRYVRASRTDGNFRVQYRNPSGRRGLMNANLKVCMYCLGATDWLGFNALSTWGERRRARQKFNLRDFFHSNASMIREIPMYSDTSMPLDDYPPDWAEISRKYRASVNWTCAKCGVNLRDFQSGLHTHHEGLKFDKNPTKFKALCALCHKLEHPGMFVDEQVAARILKLRRDQGCSN